MSKRSSKKAQPAQPAASPRRAARPSALLDTRIIYCGDCVDQLAKLPDGCVDLIYIDPPFNSNRNYEVFWGETKEKRAFEDRHASTQAYIDYTRPRCRQLARVLKPTGSFYYRCDWRASREWHGWGYKRHQPWCLRADPDRIARQQHLVGAAAPRWTARLRGGDGCMP